MSVFTDIAAHPPERAFVVGDRPKTYGELDATVDLVADALRAAGCGSGTRVGLAVDQSFEYVVALLAVRRARGISVLMAPDWTDAEKERVISEAECRLAIADFPVRPNASAPTSLDGLDAYLFVHDDVRETETTAGDDAVLLFSSGTTGVPKGVLLSEDAVSANVRAVAGYLELTPHDGAPVFTPPCYAYSLSQNLVTAWSGGRLLPVPSGLLFPMEILRAVATERLTGLSATPTAFRLLCQLDYDEPLDFSSVRYVMLGGQFLDPHLVGLTTSLFPNARVVNMYGCTENSPRITYHYVSGKSALSARGHYPVGRPVEGTEIQIAGEDGTPVVPGETGEILVRGTSLMRRYWKDPEATAERVVDGWFHTKDLGYLDAEKRLHLAGRLAIVINIGNEKVSPEEVEAVIGQVEGVVDAAVFGRPDPVLGQTVHAMVVARRGAEVDVADIQRHCRRELSGFKLPRGIEFVDELPRTHYGKIDRAALAERAESVARSDEGDLR